MKLILSILLQCKFILVAFLNITYNFIPNPFRKYYLAIWGIKLKKGSSINYNFDNIENVDEAYKIIKENIDNICDI